MSASCPDILCGSRRDDPVRSQAIDPEFKKSTLTNPGNAGVETGTVTKKLDPDLANERLNPYIIPDDNAGMPGGSSSVPSGQLDSLRGGDPIGPDVDGMGGNILKPQPGGSGGDPRM